MQISKFTYACFHSTKVLQSELKGYPLFNSLKLPILKEIRDMLPAFDVAKDMTTDVTLVQTLHDNYHRIGLGIIQTCWPHHVKPFEITFKVESPTKFHISGINKQLVGEVAAKVKKLRKADPYKGKGLRLAGEVVRRKQGKTGKK